MTAPTTPPVTTAAPIAVAESEGHHYFVMEFVDGVPITKFCDEHHLAMAARLELLYLDTSALVKLVQREPESEAAGGSAAWTLDGGARLKQIDQHVPGDISAAAFWLVAAAIHPDSELTLRDVGVNPTRIAVISILGRMHARIAGDVFHSTRVLGGELTCDLSVASSDLEATDITPEEVAAARQIASSGCHSLHSQAA